MTLLSVLGVKIIIASCLSLLCLSLESIALCRPSRLVVSDGEKRWDARCVLVCLVTVVSSNCELEIDKIKIASQRTQLLRRCKEILVGVYVARV